MPLGDRGRARLRPSNLIEFVTIRRARLFVMTSRDALDIALAGFLDRRR